MDVVGSEIGQKMRSAIKAKLTELGCYVDDELPDYVMVMVANKRTQLQMEDDLQLFLGDNTELFVNWLHQVLKKLQEVTVAVPLKIDKEKTKEISGSKERKSKEKKDKTKKSDVFKKSKKRDKEKLHHKKGQKSKKDKKDKSHERIRPNIPPLLMNMEKDLEPSITDVFAGQILKNHGVNLDVYKDDTKVEQTKLIIKGESQLKEMSEIEAKIQGLKQKLVEQLDSMSDDEDFLTIRTEAEELMNDFADDVLQEISHPGGSARGSIRDPPKAPDPIETSKPPAERPSDVPAEQSKETRTEAPVGAFPQIELNLPKRPVRDRLGLRSSAKDPELREMRKQKSSSPESFTPEREIVEAPLEPGRKTSEVASEPDEVVARRLPALGAADDSFRRVPSRVCASVVRVRPRPRADASASNLLLRAVADAHKSLLRIPPKVDTEPSTVKRALVLPMRRCVDPEKIVIRVAADGRGDRASHRFVSSSRPTEEYSPSPFGGRSPGSAHGPARTATASQDSLVIEAINIHSPTVDRDKSTQFIVTMDGYHPNAFLAKKLMTEGLLNDDDVAELKAPKGKRKSEPANRQLDLAKEDVEAVEDVADENEPEETAATNKPSDEPRSGGGKAEEAALSSAVGPKKRSSDTSEDSGTRVIITQQAERAEKRASSKGKDAPELKKRRASPIVFDVGRKVVSDAAKESAPALSGVGARCRAFPSCRFGAACAFVHPRCKFAASCTRRGCPYAHDAPPAESRAATASDLGLCKFYPNCVNPACHFYHPKPCRFGKSCANRLECNFYHADGAGKMFSL